MKILFLIWGMMFSLLCLASDSNEEKLSEQFQKKIKEQGVIKDAQKINLNGFRVEALKFDLEKNKKDSLTSAVHLSNPLTPSVAVSVTDNKNVTDSNVSVYQKKTGRPYVTMSDNDGDGVMDILSYSVLDQNGEWIKEITDYGMDGYIDFRMFLKEKKSEVRYQGKWYQVKEGLSKNSQKRKPWIEVNGVKKGLEEVLAELAK